MLLAGEQASLQTRSVRVCLDSCDIDLHAIIVSFTGQAPTATALQPL